MFAPDNECQVFKANAGIASVMTFRDVDPCQFNVIDTHIESKEDLLRGFLHELSS